MQKYPRGSRGSPAKGVVWENRSTSSNLVFCAKKRTSLWRPFFGAEDSQELVNYHEFARVVSDEKQGYRTEVGEQQSYE